jgi:hypothetical protein
VDQAVTYKVRLSDGREFGPAAIEMIVQWCREGRVPMDALLVSTDGTQVQSVLSHPVLQATLQSPPTVSPGVPAASQTEAPMSGMIPYKNPPALIGYYMAVASLIPFLGAAFGLAAVILGIIGLRKRMRNPAVRGMAHALIAIIGGGFFLIVWGGIFILAMIGAATN